MTPYETTLEYITTKLGPVIEPPVPGEPWRLKKTSRDHLPSVCRAMGFLSGAEVGVWKGGYSAKFAKDAPAMHMLCVDSWAQHDGWDDGKASSAEKINEAYKIAQSVLAGSGATIIRDYSVEAATRVPDGSLDFCYIDGNHKYQPVLDDLEAWAPKVRSGGILAGHDYRIFSDKPYIQVVPALLAYTAAHQINPWFLTWADSTPSWLWVKR